MDLRQQHSLQFSTDKQNKPSPDAVEPQLQDNEAHSHALKARVPCLCTLLLQCLFRIGRWDGLWTRAGVC